MALNSRHRQEGLLYWHAGRSGRKVGDAQLPDGYLRIDRAGALLPRASSIARS